VESVVREIVHGRTVKHQEALNLNRDLAEFGV